MNPPESATPDSPEPHSKSRVKTRKRSRSNTNHHNSVRVTLKSHTPDEDSFYFENVTFELFDEERPMTLCRVEHRTNKAAIVHVNRICFASRTVSKGQHARIRRASREDFLKATLQAWNNGYFRPRLHCSKPCFCQQMIQ